MTTGNNVVGKFTVAIQFRVCLGNHILTFLNSRQIVNFIGDASILHLAVWRFHKAILIGAGIQRQRINQTNVGAFWRFNRAHTAIMGGMHIAHLKPCALAG